MAQTDVKKKKKFKLINCITSYVKGGQSLIFRLIILNEISRTQRFYFTTSFFLLVFAPNDLKRCNYKTNNENRLEFRSPNTPLEPRTSARRSARDASPSSAEGQTGLRCPLQSRDAALRGRVRRKDGRKDRRKEGRIGRPKDCAKGKLKNNRGVDVLRKNILEIYR